MEVEWEEEVHRVNRGGKESERERERENKKMMMINF